MPGDPERGGDRRRPDPLRRLKAAENELAPPSGDVRDPAPGSSGRLGDLLREAAAHHEPDVGRILARMSAAPEGEPDPAAARTARVGHDVLGTAAVRRGRVCGRPRLAWPVAAAGVTVLTIVTVAAAHVLTAPPGRDDATNAAAVTTSAGPSSTAAGTPEPALSTSAPVSPSTLRGPTAIPTGGRSSTAVTSPATALSRAVSIGVAPQAGTTTLTLPQAGTRDWIVVGGRSDGVLVRAKAPARPLGTVTVSGYGPSVVDGPYLVSWSGGVPEQDRTGDTTWQSITAVDGRLRITVPLKGDRFTVDLYAGTNRTTGKVRVQAPDVAATVSAVIAPCSVDVCADVVSVSVDPAQLPGGGASGDLVIDLGPAQPGVGLGVGLAAVVLR